MFTTEKKLHSALGRAGRLLTSHGAIETPAFVVVGTKATVKALTPVHIKEAGAEVVLGNTYHLYLEPGETIVQEAGGIGKFMGWDGPTMTDSGGFQVFSLGADFNKKIGKVKRSSVIPSKSLPPAKAGAGIQKRKLDPRLRGDDTRVEALVSIDEEGVTFKSYKDGSEHRFTPERSVEIQHALGADIIFAFDECTSPNASCEYQKEAMVRTHRWAARCLERHRELKNQNAKGKIESEQILFGIVQGGRFEDLRKESARVIGRMELARPDGSRGARLYDAVGQGFDGFGIGGSFGENDMGNAVRWVNEILPEEKPRHLLGIGDPLDLFGAVENGCDLFDCVAPTREARNGSLYTKHGRCNIENARYKKDFTPIEENCECYSCRHFTKAYLAHLFRSNEILANTLATIHNVHFIVQLVRNIRHSILHGDFFRLRDTFFNLYRCNN